MKRQGESWKAEADHIPKKHEVNAIPRKARSETLPSSNPGGEVP